MGHRLMDHSSKCRNLHGHRYKAEVTLIGSIVSRDWSSDNGMIADFADIKNVAKSYIDTYLDHSYMFQSQDPIGDLCEQLGLQCIQVPFPPTAEHLADFLFTQLDILYQQHLKESVKLHSITLRETPNSYVQRIRDTDS